MKSNIGKIAFACFERKARQLNSKLIRGNASTISFEDVCIEQTSIYLWSWEKGFEYMKIKQYLESEKIATLGLVVAKIIADHVDKKDDSFIPSHLGMYSKNKKEVSYFSIARMPGLDDETGKIKLLNEALNLSNGVDFLQKMIEGCAF